jgi:hypothetical protein
LGASTAVTRDGSTPPLLLWIGMLAGPGAWATDLGISYALVQWSCSSQRSDVLHGISVGAFSIAVAGALLSWSLVKHLTRTGNAGGEGEHRARFMALLGVASNALFALAIVAFAIPRWILDACY